MRKLNTMQDVLSKWALKEFRSVQNSIKGLRAKLQNFRLLPPSPDIDKKIKATETELNEWLLREELMWR